MLVLFYGERVVREENDVLSTVHPITSTRVAERKETLR